MSLNLDRALDVLEGHGQQHSDEPVVHRGDEWCWRCGVGPVNPIGVCGPCAAWLTGVSDVDPAEGYDDDVYAPLDAETLAAIAEQITRDTLVELREMRGALELVGTVSAKVGRALVRLGDTIRSLDCQITPVPAKTAHRRRYQTRR